LSYRAIVFFLFLLVLLLLGGGGCGGGGVLVAQVELAVFAAFVLDAVVLAAILFTKNFFIFIFPNKFSFTFMFVAAKEVAAAATYQSDNKTYHTQSDKDAQS